MTYVTSEARQDLLDTVAEAIDAIGSAVTTLGDVYELLDEHSGDVLEEQLFRPVQVAYGRARRTHADFAARHALRPRTFEPGPSLGPPSAGAHGLLEQALDAVADADDGLSTLQDSMLPVEVGDEALRAGLSEVRRLLGDLPERARRFERSLGR